jgi:hypothetical protein
MAAFSEPCHNLCKEDIAPGFVLWLPTKTKAIEQDAEACARSKIEVGAFDHPVFVVDTLDPTHDFLWIAIVSRPFLLSFTLNF